MTIYDLAEKFICSDPKAQVCVEDQLNNTVYEGRIEFLYNCNNPIEDKEITEMQFGYLHDDGKFRSDVLWVLIKI